MSDRTFSFGSGVPPGWSAKSAIENARQSAFENVFPSSMPSGAGMLASDSSGFEDLDLTKDLDGNDLVRSGLWKVRDQGNRGTCNAFAVVAAEELYAYYHKEPGSMVPLSEEYLYAQTRKVRPLDVGIDISEKGRQELEESGGTFLAQVRQALDNAGICSADLMKYDADKPPNYVVGDVPIVAMNDGARRRVPKDEFEHDITKNPETGLNRHWENGGANVFVSGLFAELLRKKIPVVASFAILEGQAYRWVNEPAETVGEVNYPPVLRARELEPVGGHAVCLVGMQANQDGNSDHPGWFLFRNSYGVDDFAKFANSDKNRPVSPGPGYGTISAFDVDRYCWEYLARKS